MLITKTSRLKVDGTYYGPDFPTAAIINGRRGILDAYRTGRGKIYIRAQADIETDEKTGRETIIVTEIPYQVNKARLIEKLQSLLKISVLKVLADYVTSLIKTVCVLSLKSNVMLWVKWY